MSSYLESSGFRHKRQFGFRSGLNCEMAVLDLVEGIRRDASEGRIVLAAFEKFSVAFNCIFGSVIVDQLVSAVSHGRLLESLLTL